MKELPAQILSGVTEPVLLAAARSEASTRLSFADALIAAHAAQSASVLLHKDPEYQALAEDVTLEALPFKG